MISSPPPSERNIPGRLLPWLLTVAVAAGALVFTAHYVNSERFFWFWDSFAYHRASLESLQRMEGGGVAWLQGLRVSMQSGFSQLFTTPLVPLMRWLGDGRAVYIGGLVGFYLLPFAWVASRIVNRFAPASRWASPLVFATCAALPVLWRATLSGYPDIGGATVAMLAVLVYFRDPTLRSWSTAGQLGLIFAAAFLFRRHLIYCVIAMMTAISGFTVVRIAIEEKAHRWRRLGGSVLKMAAVTGIVLAAIALIAPAYFAELTSTNFRELYKPFQQSVRLAFDQHWGLVGALYWLLAAAGFALAWRRREHRWAIAFLLGHLAVSFAIWTLYLRYLSIQYNLHFAFVVSCGIGALIASVWSRGRSGPFLAGVIAVLVVGLWADRLSDGARMPVFAERLLPVQLPPLRDRNYDELARLIRHLRTVDTNPASPVHVAASSIVINSDLLTNGEGALFGRANRRLGFMNGSHADTVQPYTLRDLVAADWMVQVTPLQLHLRLEDQGVVESVHRAFRESWPIAGDFSAESETFHLLPEMEVQIFRRIRPSGLAAQIDAARRMFDIVDVQSAWTGPWMMGRAATGAEYFDARLIVPRQPNIYYADLTQVRPGAGEPNVTMFGRMTVDRPHLLTGMPNGSGVAGWTMRLSLHPDSGASIDPWEQEMALAAGVPFSVALPNRGRAVVAIELCPAVPLPAGTPLGWGIEQLQLRPE